MNAQDLHNYKFDKDGINDVAKIILAIDPECKLFLFDAQMGAGKTTLIKEMCKILGSKDNFSSPTFSIINEYSYPKGKIFHIDLYRIKDLNEALDMGIEEYLHSGHYCFIEWPQVLDEITEIKHINITIKPEDNIRYISATKKQ